MYVFSIVLIVASSILYNVCQKGTPETANPFSSLIVTYLTASIITLTTFLCFYTDKNLLKSLEDLNWTSVALGIAIVGLELGYLMAYRSGWDISMGALVSNILLAIILIPVGVLLYKEGFSLHKTFGVVFCMIGLLLLNKS